MKDIILFIAQYTQYIAESQSHAEGVAVILFLGLCLGLALAIAGGTACLIQKAANIADKNTTKSKQRIA